MEWLADPNAWIALLTLSVLEIVLGIDNIVFISVLTGRLPKAQQANARRVGLALALVMRVGLLLTISWVIGLTAPLFTLLGIELSGRDLILIGGGIFLLAKATTEIHGALEGEDGEASARAQQPGGGTEDVPDRRRAAATFGSTIVQIGLLDIVFSLDSVITAVGMANDIPVMIAAIVIAIAVMLLAAGPLSAFVEEHPTVKMLALSFLLLIGMSLVADGFDVHIPKGYIYFAMGFSVFVEVLNIRVRRRVRPIHLRPGLGDQPPNGE
jgi:predicted tellurium resistance membrane protein TerC